MNEEIGDTPEGEFRKMQVLSKKSAVDSAKRNLKQYLNEKTMGLDVVKRLSVYEDKLVIKVERAEDIWSVFETLESLFPWHVVGESTTYGEDNSEGSLTLVPDEERDRDG